MVWKRTKYCTACTCCIAKCSFADTRQNLRVAKADTETEWFVEATKIVDFQSQQLRKLTQNTMRTNPVTSHEKAPGVNALKLLKMSSGTDRIAFGAVNSDVLTLSCRILCRNTGGIRHMRAVCC